MVNRPEYEDTEDEEHAKVEQLPFGFAKPDQPLSDALHGWSDRQATDKGGDEAVAPDLVGKRPGNERQSQQDETLERFGHPPSFRGPPHQPAPNQPNAYADENTEADLLEGEAYP